MPLYLSFERRHSAGQRLTPMGGGGGGGAATAAQNYTAYQQAELSKEQLQWSKEVYASQAGERDEAAQIGREASQAALTQQRLQTQIQQRAADDYEQNYRPLEQKIVTDAQNYDTPERRAAESASAMADVETQISASRASTAREQERAGLNPNSAKTLASQSAMDVGAAKVKAGAGNAASKAVETIGYARRMDAANLGRNIASSQGTSAALGLQAGAAANASGAAGLAAGQSGVAAMNQGYAGAQSGLGAAANTYGAISGNEAAAGAAKSAQTGAAVGAVATVAAAVII